MTIAKTKITLITIAINVMKHGNVMILMRVPVTNENSGFTRRADSMCNGCDSFPCGCGSPVCLTGKENEDEKFVSKLSKEQQELIRIIVEKFYSKYST